MAIQIDLDQLTLDELEALGDMLGLDPTQLDERWRPKDWKQQMALTRVYLWVLKRREDPAFSLADTGRLPVEEVKALIALVPPTAGDEASDVDSSVGSRPSRKSTGSRRKRSGA